MIRRKAFGPLGSVVCRGRVTLLDQRTLTLAAGLQMIALVDILLNGDANERVRTGTWNPKPVRLDQLKRLDPEQYLVFWC